MNTTIDYYNNNAQEYYKKTINLDISESISFFIKELEKNNKKKFKVLDLGAGSGRDSLFFLKQGYVVVALEPSIELAKIIKKNVGCEVWNIFAQDMTFNNKFDGIYASASLLHIDKKDMPKVLTNIKNALKPNGVVYISLKIGKGTSIDNDQRLFNYYEEKEIEQMLIEHGFIDMKFLTTEDKMSRQDTQWISIVAKNTLNLTNKLKF